MPETDLPVLPLTPDLWNQVWPGALHRSLENVQDLLRQVQAGCGEEVQLLGRDFEALSQRITLLLGSVRAVVDCATGERMQALLASLQSLASAVREQVQARLADADRARDMLRAESAALKRLSTLMHSQKIMVRETEVLRVLTRIEVARLGAEGCGFQYLADELDDFSQTLQRSVGALTGQTSERRSLIEAGYDSLLRALPRIRRQFQALEEAVGQAAAQARESMARLSAIPGQYQACVERIAGLTAGIIAAIQTQDITRQQIDHVCAALPPLAAMIADAQAGEELSSADLSLLRTTLRVQILQLRSAKCTVSAWTSRICACLEAIMTVSSDDIEAFASTVLQQEQALAAQLTAMESFDRECRSGQLEVERSLRGIQSLMTLVREHLERSTAIRDRLQLLMFNSIIEARSLGSRADGIREISVSIRRLSARWKAITSESETILGEMLAIAAHTRVDTDAAAGGAAADFCFGPVLESLRSIGSCAERETLEVRAALAPLRTSGAQIASAVARLGKSFAALDDALAAAEAVEAELRSLPGEETLPPNFAELLAESYTTQTEREVLRAALAGEALPENTVNGAGNDVELF